MTAPLPLDPRPVRVLIVDDSAYMRHVISQHLNAAPGLSVVGAARDGREALDLIPALDPDVITLDVDMPRLDGLATLREIMAHFPRPVVMLSGLVTESANETVQALTWGAVDFVAKPSLRANVAAVMNDVVAKVRLAASAQVQPLALSPAIARTRPFIQRPLTPAVARRAAPDKVIVMGASTGGPRALTTVLAALPADLPAAILIVQHMPVGFTRPLADRLNKISPLAIKEAEAGDALEAGQALLAPAGFHMTLDEHGRIALNQNPPLHGVRPAMDVTMAAVAQRYPGAAIGVVLTGMGSDGRHGSALIHAAGGQVIAEAESSCVVWGMPRSVAEAGLADAVVPLPEIAAAIRHAVPAQPALHPAGRFSPGGEPPG